MENGFITIHRKIKDNPIWQNPLLLQLFINLLLEANYKESKFLFNGNEIVLKRGQLITGRFKLFGQTGINPNTIYKLLNTLERLKIIEIESNNKFSLITILKYDDYQQQHDKSNNKITTKEQPSNNKVTQSNKNNKNNKEIINTMQPTAADESKQILDIFYKSVNPALRYGNKTYWSSAQELIKQVGIEKALNAAKYAVSIQNQKYAPVITNPYQLITKYGELQSFYAKNNIKNSEVAKI